MSEGEPRRSGRRRRAQETMQAAAQAAAQAVREERERERVNCGMRLSSVCVPSELQRQSESELQGDCIRRS